MNVNSIPFIKQIRDSGPDNRIFDALLLAGPIIVVILVLMGRTLPTIGLATTYLVVFIVYILSKGFR